MWCSVGYSTFTEIQKALRRVVKSEAGFSKVLETMNTGGAYYELGLPFTPARTLSYAHAQKTVLHECIEEFFQNCASLSVFSPSGTCLRIDAGIAAHREIPGLGWEYSFIDKQLGIVSGDNFEKCFSIAEKHLALMRLSIEEIDACEAAYSHYCELCKIEDDFQMWNAFKIFDGWSIGCAEEELDFNECDFVALDLVSGHEDVNERPPNLKEAIIEAFDSHLIRSKHKLWKERFKDETREAFRAAWAEAAQERPELSKRGPK